MNNITVSRKNKTVELPAGNPFNIAYSDGFEENGFLFIRSGLVFQDGESLHLTIESAYPHMVIFTKYWENDELVLVVKFLGDMANPGDIIAKAWLMEEKPAKVRFLEVTGKGERIIRGDAKPALKGKGTGNAD